MMHAPFNQVLVPDELLEIIFAFLGPKTLMITVPQVCRQWRQVCQGLVGVHLDFRWWNGMVPVGALAGATDTPFVRANPGWVTGLCQLFPHTAAASFKEENGVTDEGVVALAKGCPGLTSVSFSRCENLTDVAVVALAQGCLGLTSVIFRGCAKLTDA